MIKRTINRTVGGHSRNDQEEALKGILNFARQALVPENAISLEDLREVGEVTKRSVNYDAIKVYLNELAADVYDRQIKKLRSEEAIREFQKVLILMVVDNKWTDHIDALINYVMPLVCVVMPKTTQSLSINLKGSRCSKI